MDYLPQDAATHGRAQSALHACHTAAPEASYPRGQAPVPSTSKRKRHKQNLTYKSQLNVCATNRTCAFQQCQINMCK